VIASTASSPVFYRFIRPDGIVLYQEAVAECMDFGWNIRPDENVVDLGYDQWLNPPWILQRRDTTHTDWTTVHKRTAWIA